MRRVPRIHEELKQSRPFRLRTAEAGAAVLRTADLIRRYIDSAFAPYGITWQQYNVLRILRGARPNGLPTLSIAERMVERTPGVTRLVDRLVRKNLVTRARGTVDSRQVICRITRRGLGLTARLERPLDEADDFMMGALSDRELATLIKLLGRARTRISGALPPSGAST